MRPTTLRRVSSLSAKKSKGGPGEESADTKQASAGKPRQLWCDGISKSYDGKRWQFRDLTFGIGEGARIGLVGVNGVGKSTLMKCLAGIEVPDKGVVGVEGKPSIIYVEQEPARGDGTVADALTEPMVVGSSAEGPAAARTAAGLRALRKFWRATSAAEAAMGGDGDGALGGAMAAMDETGGWELETRLEAVASRSAPNDIVKLAWGGKGVRFSI